MALAGRVSIAVIAAAGLVGGGALLWSQYGGLVYFDMLTSAVSGCFL
jgi:hypothetical protein